MFFLTKVKNVEGAFWVTLPNINEQEFSYTKPSLDAKDHEVADIDNN